MLSGAARFFEYARERYKIKLARDQGLPSPWTADPILQQYRFCNVFREDDRVTRWVRGQITEKGYGALLLRAIFIARWFNRIETLERLLPGEDAATPFWARNLLFVWDPAELRSRLGGMSPLVTAAYMVKTPSGMNKLEGIIWIVERFLRREGELVGSLTAPGRSLQEATSLLGELPYMGPFYAYEVVTDLRHSWLRDAPDIMTWANPGPGAARGVCRALGLHKDVLKRNCEPDRELMIDTMRGLLARSREPAYWPSKWPTWEMRDVEHTLCEFDKYERALRGDGRPKQIFTPHA